MVATNGIFTLVYSHWYIHIGIQQFFVVTLFGWEASISILSKIIVKLQQKNYLQSNFQYLNIF
jgi:hypothetical protein